MESSEVVYRANVRVAVRDLHLHLVAAFALPRASDIDLAGRYRIVEWKTARSRHEPDRR